MSSRDTLSDLLKKNALLRCRIQRRCDQVNSELAFLHTLRASLMQFATRGIKRQRVDPYILNATRLHEDGTPADRWTPSLIDRLFAEAASQELSEEDTNKFNLRKWRLVAAAMRLSGGPSFTPFECYLKWRESSLSPEPFSMSESKLICSHVQKYGYDWTDLTNEIKRKFAQQRSIFDVAQHYRLALRRAFVENHLTQSEIEALLAEVGQRNGNVDTDRLSVLSRRYVSHKSLQVSPIYLRREADRLSFLHRIPTHQHLYWKILNLLCRFPLPSQYRIDEIHYRSHLCFQQLSLEALARLCQCTPQEVREKLVQHLLHARRALSTLNFEACSKAVFGDSYAATLICQLALEIQGAA